MKPFVRLEAVAVPMEGRNLDTNQLCPTRFNKVPIGDPDYPRILFHNQRFSGDGTEIPDFILNREPFRRAGIMVGDENFGCGSSRESAVYALLAFGIRSVLAPSFGDIFHANCTKNGLLPVVLSKEVCDRIRAALHARPGTRLKVDLEAQRVEGPDGESHRFDVHPTVRRCLLQGLDDIDLTLQHAGAIDAFEARHHRRMPWVFGSAEGRAAGQGNRGLREREPGILRPDFGDRPHSPRSRRW